MVDLLLCQTYTRAELFFDGNALFEYLLLIQKRGQGARHVTRQALGPPPEFPDVSSFPFRFLLLRPIITTSTILYGTGHQIIRAP
jgi:hypothetical protein